MKYIRQFLIILSVSCSGEVLNHLIPLPIPASIYGLVIMLGLLVSKKLRLEAVENVANFLVEIMPVLFIPAAVGLIVSWKQLESMLIPALLITVASTVLVILVTGKITDLLISKKGAGKNECFVSKL